MDRPSSYQGDYQLTSQTYARPRILLIRSNTDRTSQQVTKKHLPLEKDYLCNNDGVQDNDYYLSNWQIIGR